MPQIRLNGVTRYYKKDRRKIAAVKDITLTIEQGDFLFVTGSSGAGKSTMLKLMCGRLYPSSGTVFLDRLNIPRIARWRPGVLRRYFGYVSQVSAFERKKTIGQNVLEATVPHLTGPPTKERVLQGLKTVGLADAMDRYPAQLSLADCRKAELVAAIINRPPVLILDELTADLDEDSIWDIMQLLNEINRLGSTIVMATHAKKFVNILRKRVITLVDGRIWGDVLQGRYGDIS